MAAIKASLLKVDKIKDSKGKEYFLATSKSIPGLLAYGKTLQEAVKNAEDVARSMVRHKKQNKLAKKQEFKVSYTHSFSV